MSTEKKNTEKKNADKTKKSTSKRICLHCLKEGIGLLTCSRCQVAHYCDKACQIAHWTGQFIPSNPLTININ